MSRGYDGKTFPLQASISDRLNLHHRMNLPSSIALKVGSPLDLTPISLRSYHFVLAAWGEKQAQSQSPL